MDMKTKVVQHVLRINISMSQTQSHSHSLTLDMLSNFCFPVYAQKSRFIGENANVFLTSTTTSREVRVHRAGSQLKMSTWQKLGTSVAVTVTVSVSVTCLCWSLGHGEQLLFSCLSSKVIICNYVTCHLSHFAFQLSHVICEMLMLILWTCWTTFVLMSMRKSEYL